MRRGSWRTPPACGSSQWPLPPHRVRDRRSRSPPTGNPPTPITRTGTCSRRWPPSPGACRRTRSTSPRRRKRSSTRRGRRYRPTSTTHRRIPAPWPRCPTRPAGRCSPRFPDRLVRLGNLGEHRPAGRVGQRGQGAGMRLWVVEVGLYLLPRLVDERLRLLGEVLLVLRQAPGLGGHRREQVPVRVIGVGGFPVGGDRDRLSRTRWGGKGYREDPHAGGVRQLPRLIGGHLPGQLGERLGAHLLWQRAEVFGERVESGILLRRDPGESRVAGDLVLRRDVFFTGRVLLALVHQHTRVCLHRT